MPYFIMRILEDIYEFFVEKKLGWAVVGIMVFAILLVAGITYVQW
jgi:hypothetical protein